MRSDRVGKQKHQIDPKQMNYTHGYIFENAKLMIFIQRLSRWLRNFRASRFDAISTIYYDAIQ